MDISVDLISQFAKLTTNKEKSKSETTVYGTTVEYEDRMYVKLDGSDLLTPVLTTTDMVAGERVSVLLKNHTATVTGNLTSPSARTDDMKNVGAAVGELSSKISEFEIIVSDKITTKDLDAINGRIDTLVSDNITVKQSLTATEASIETLEADVETVNESLTAANADIENLETNKLDVNIANAKFATIENLTATNADLNNLEATYAAFEVATANRLTVSEGDISKLKTDKLDAASANITYAKIADLNAANADITKLESDVATIDTLIFGSATGNTIHTSFANAVIAQLGNAQIKSAMIDTLSANKITSGDINTNNIRVVSEDGSLIISDETIQIKDGTRVRVQIGKDASNDYSINVWDVNGNLMFSEGGITDKAIKTAIIRDDMVSDTANIAAHKLDIDSLFEEINGSTKTIKSSKIYLDEKNQKLDVAFETMSTDLNELQNGVATQGTQITAIQGQITSKVWQQDINTAVSAVEGETEALATKYSEIQQEVDSVKTTVSSHTSSIAKKADSSTVQSVIERVTAAETAIDQQADALTLRATKTEVSTAKTEAISAASADATTKANTALTNANTNTTNLLKSYSTTAQMNAAIQLKADGITSSVSTTYATKTALNTTQQELDKLEVGGRNLYRNSDIEQTSSRFLSVNTYDIFADHVGREVTISFDAIILSGGTSRELEMYPYQSNGISIAATFKFTPTTEWKRFAFTTTVKDWGIQNASYTPGAIGFYDRTGDNSYTIRRIKMELGNRPTDWTPAPEDMATADDVESTQSSITLAEERLGNAESIIEQLSNSISMLVTDGKGQSLMTQTSTGWTFSTAGLQDIVQSASENLGVLTDQVGDVNAAVGGLKQAVSDLGVLNEYVRITKYEGEPCIELGQNDNDFKLLITNTRILFMEGTDIPAYISNQSLHIEKAVIEEELQQGEFVWKSRSNGNLGLVWKGGD